MLHQRQDTRSEKLNGQRLVVTTASSAWRKRSTGNGRAHCPYHRCLICGPPRFAATPYIDPVTAPVTAKKTGLLVASPRTGTTVIIKVMVPPDVLLKRPVPPVI
jgi:hypothetical protein